MAIYGFDLTDNIEALTWKNLPGEFSTLAVQVIIESTYPAELKDAAANRDHNPWHITRQEIANRVADRLVQKWKKLGKLKLKARSTWVKV